MDGRERAQLAERHLDLARRAAAMIYPRVRDHIALDELVALANTGLAEAASRYDPDRGAAFATFAWYRVNGAIIDGLRKATQLPRRTWARLVALRAASEYLENRAERDVGAAQRGAAPAAGSDALAQIQRAMSAIRTMYVTSLEAMRDRGFDVGEAPEIERQLDTRRLAGKLREAIDALPERERALMTKHYWEGKNLLEAGAELGMSKSWASRAHAQVVDKLRVILDDS
ncbi:MAG TPA: sigma-70 family RNA polymerase sigma factor [Kofleriaceae bacterium]|nr:sigma-70 family RNA polymerase sigma factor [Kofleriaceae bacterium]